MRSWKTGLIAVAVTLLPACSEDPTGPEASPEGTWSLSSVGGQTLPYRTYADHQTAIYLSSGTRVILPDGTCTNYSTSETYTRDVWGDVAQTTRTTESQCTWSREGRNRFAIRSGDGFVMEARVDGSELVVTAPSGTEYRYR
jgi:hypothetical protein